MFRHSLLITAIFALTYTSSAQEIHFRSLPAGYVAGSIPLPRGFAGALSTHPTDDNYIYASLGDYGSNDLALINVSTKQVTTIATGKFKCLNGIAPLSATKIVCTDNYGSNSGMPNDTIVLLSDENTDGDFDDAGEITELISPILVDDAVFGFTGAQTRVCPPGNSCNLPAGSILVQTGDGAIGTGGEILAIVIPLNSPSYSPAAASFFTGFDFYGGMAFDNQKRLIVGEQTSFLGSIHILSNKNADEDIDPDESNALITGQSFLADLTVDAENDIFFCASNGTDCAIRTAHIPADPMNETATASDFAATDSSYLTAVTVSSTNKAFEANQATNAAILVTSGFDADYRAAKNLLTLRPKDGLSDVATWEAYK